MTFVGPSFFLRKLGTFALSKWWWGTSLYKMKGYWASGAVHVALHSKVGVTDFYGSHVDQI